MRFRGLICAVVMAGIFAIATEPARAYYDDTHYSLTYYMARSCGFTPLQAYRLASADVSVDDSPLTEPVQKDAVSPLSAQFLSESAQNARTAFHAMWDSRLPTDRSLADAALKGRELQLFQLATTQRNAGILLHYVQDEGPHAGYASRGGHWVPSTPLEKLESNLPFGATTDFLSNNQQRTLLMAQHSMDAMMKFMRTMAPRQRSSLRCNIAAVLPMLDTLIAVNPVSSAAAQYAAKVLDIGSGGIISVDRFESAMKLLPFNEELTKSGPQVKKADEAVTAAITAQADLTMYAPFENREKYTYDGKGNVTGNSDSFPLYEDLNATVRDAAGRSVEVSVWAAPTRPFEKPYQLDCKAASGLTRFEKLPVGNLIMQTVVDGKVTRTPFRLDKSGQSAQLSLMPIKKGETTSECRKEVAKKAAAVCESGRSPLASQAPINGADSQRLEDEFQQASDSCDKKEEEQKRTENTENTEQPPPSPKGGGGGSAKLVVGLLATGAAVAGGVVAAGALKQTLDEYSTLSNTSSTTSTPTTTSTNASAGNYRATVTDTCTSGANGDVTLGQIGTPCSKVVGGACGAAPTSFSFTVSATGAVRNECWLSDANISGGVYTGKLWTVTCDDPAVSGSLPGTWNLTCTEGRTRPATHRVSVVVTKQ